MSTSPRCAVLLRPRPARGPDGAARGCPALRAFAAAALLLGGAHAQVQRFDMGTSTSPTAANYVQVTANTMWAPGGSGWVAGSGTVAGVDRPVASPYVIHNQDPNLLRDSNVITSASATFRVSVSAGLRMCVVYIGDIGESPPLPPAAPVQDIDVHADGVLVAADVFARTVRKKASFDGSIGGYKRVAFIADPGSDGVLDLTFSGSGVSRIPVQSVEIYGYSRPPIWFDHATNKLKTFAPVGNVLNTIVALMNAHDYAAARTAIDGMTGNDLGKAWAYAWLTGWLTGSADDVDASLLRDPNVPGGPGAIENLLLGLNQDNAAVALLLAETRDFARGELFLASRGYTLALFPENPDSIPNPSVPAVGDIIANSCAGVQLLEQMHGDVLDLAPDGTQTQSPYFAKAQYLIARNMYGRNTQVMRDVDPDSAVAYDQYFLGIWHALWSRLDPGAGASRIFPKAIDVGVQAWLFENYIDWNVPDNGPLLLPWDGTPPTASTPSTPVGFPAAEFANAWWAGQVAFDWSQVDVGHTQWRYAHMMRDLVRWWGTERSRSGDWGGGGGDNVEGLGALGVPLVTVQEGGANTVEGAIREGLERVLYGPEVDQSQGYWNAGAYIDAEHGAEYTTIPLMLLMPTNYGDPAYVEFTMRLMRNLEEPSAPSTAWTGLGGATPWRHFRAFRFGAYGVEPASNPGNPDMDITECMKAILPGFPLLAFTGIPRVASLWYEYGRAWSYEALRTDDAAKPVGVLPVGVDYATGVMGEGPGLWWSNQQQNGGEVGLYNLEIYLAMLTAYRTHNQDLELLRPIARVIEFVNSTVPDPSKPPGSIRWTAGKVVGAATKIALAAKGELEANASALGFDPAAIQTIVGNHGGAYAKYVLAQTPPAGKDKSGLIAMWSTDGAWLRWFWPFATVAVTYTDRIKFAAHGGSGEGMRGLHEVRGGVPFQGSLSYAFTWYDSTPVVTGPAGELDFAVVVNELDLRPTAGVKATVLLHNVGTSPRRIGMRAWQLPLGVYDVRGGPDANGDDRIDTATWSYVGKTLDQPGIPLISGLIGAGEVQVVEFDLVTSNPTAAQLADPAIGRYDIAFSPGGQVFLTVHNLGAVPTVTGIHAELRAPNGALLSTVSNLPVIAAPTNLDPQSLTVTFPGFVAAVGETVVAKLVVPSAMPQITTFNDTATATRQ